MRQCAPKLCLTDSFASFSYSSSRKTLIASAFAVPCIAGSHADAFIFADRTKCMTEALNRGSSQPANVCVLGLETTRKCANSMEPVTRVGWQCALSSAAVRGEFYIGADGRRCSAGDRWLDRSLARFKGSNVFYQPCRAAFGQLPSFIAAAFKTCDSPLHSETRPPDRAAFDSDDGLPCGGLSTPTTFPMMIVAQPAQNRCSDQPAR